MKTLFILATHGDEGFSIPVLKKLESKYPRDSYAYDWIIGNPEALKQQKRYVEVDLNRNAPGSVKAAAYEERRAAEIIQTAKDYEVVIDIHGARSDCGICTIISYPTVNNLLLATQLGCKNNVIWNAIISRVKGPVHQHVEVPAVELECGPQESEETAEELYGILERYMEKKNSWSFVPSRVKWYAVSKQLNKKDFPVGEMSDFEEYPSEVGKVIPFLAKNTYADGTFYGLTRVDFERLFEI